MTAEGDWSESDEDYADLEDRVNANIGSALGGERVKPVGFRLLCIREPRPGRSACTRGSRLIAPPITWPFRSAPWREREAGSLRSQPRDLQAGTDR